MASRKSYPVSSSIKADPSFSKILFEINGISPLVVNRFSAKSMIMMARKMEEGHASKSKRNKEPRDFDADFMNAIHISSDGWYGVPAISFRSAMISACRLVGIKMTIAKLAIFVEDEGVDAEDGSGLIKILSDSEPEKFVAPVRNATGVADIRVRPMWKKWGANVVISHDSDVLSKDHVVGLMKRAGFQVGICEGRPDSRSSCGMGWGRWEVVNYESL